MTINPKMLLVLWPKPGTRAAGVIDPGSGVVTDPTFDRLPDLVSEDDPFAGVTAAFDGRIKPYLLVYYEGNRYDAENLRLYEQRVLCAAGRCVERYPTMARGVFPREDFEVIGTVTYDPVPTVVIEASGLRMTRLFPGEQ